MAKLHELLAVEGDLEGTFKKILQETKKTFKEKGAFFFKTEKEVKLFDENAHQPPMEKQEMVTTVKDKLDYTNEHVIRYFNAVAQKEKTNQEAFADLEVDGKPIMKMVPATLLLGLESRLKMVRDVYGEIPTLPPGGKWNKDTNEGDNIYFNDNIETRFKTAKTFVHKILYEATKEHPAQIEKWEEQQNVGEIILRVWSGMLSPKEKSDLLSRLDKLIRAVKRARQRANNTDVADISIGKEIFDYIHQVK